MPETCPLEPPGKDQNPVGISTNLIVGGTLNLLKLAQQYGTIKDSLVDSNRYFP